MKKVYTKPELDTKAYAQFENVFTACSKGNPTKPNCQPDTYATPNDGLFYSAAYGNDTSGA